ncbi:MAG: UDP-N-acetylglucosamine 2-epimerase (non-hydrolyzing) [Alphaproteobacteria bacterium]
MKKSILTVVGNRPQFIKMAPVSRALVAHGVAETVVHTGQHYDDKLSAIFFRELGMKEPEIRLDVEGRSHGAMTGEMLAKLEAVYLERKPKHVLVYGDTNTTLAAALAAVKLHIKVAHVEAGPRLIERTMPEEFNRVMVDHISTLLFCADEASVANLKKENLTRGVILTGDVMLDAFNLFSAEAATKSTLLQNPKLKDGFAFMTLHRPANVDDEASLRRLLGFIGRIPSVVLFPVHLRTRARLEEFGLRAAFDALPNLILAEPLGYLDTVAALTACDSVLTDSGGLQKEAYYAGKTSVVLQDETPWPDLRDSQWLYVAGTIPNCDPETVLAKLAMPKPKTAPAFYGDGHAAGIIVRSLEENGFFN